MKKVKQVLSLALAVAMCFALCTPIHAATSEFTGEDALVKIVGTSAEKKITLDWQLTASKISGTQYILVTYDATRLKLLDCDGKAVTPKASVGGALNNFADDGVFLTNPGTLGSRGVSYTEMGCEDDGRGFLYLSAAPTAASTKFAGGASVLEFYFESVGNVSELTQNDLRYVTAEEAGAHNQASAVNVHVVKDGAYDDDIGYNVSSSAVTWHFQTAPTLTVNGSPLPAGRVELKTITLAASATTATVPTGNTAAEIAAPTMTVTDTGASTDGVKFNLYTAADGNTVYSKTGVTVDTATGKVTVAKTASGSLNDGPNKCYLIAKKDAIVSNAIELTITKAAPVVADYKVTLNPNSNSIKAGASVTLTVSDIKDQYGNAKNDVTTATFAKSTTTEAGITVSGSGLVGTVSVAAGTAAGKSDKIKVTVGGVDKEYTFTVADKDASQVTAIKATPSSVKVGGEFTGSLVGTSNGETVTWRVKSGPAVLKGSATGNTATFTANGVGTVVIEATQPDSATKKGFTKECNVTVADKDPSAKPTVNIAITGGTADGKVVAGEAVTLTANVSGTGVTEANCTYAWTKGGTPAGTGKTLSIAAFDPATDAVKYTCVVTHTQDANHSATVSDPAEITLSEKTLESVTVTAKTGLTSFKTGAVSSIKVSDLMDITPTAAKALVDANGSVKFYEEYEKTAAVPGTPAVGNPGDPDYVPEVPATPAVKGWREVTTLAAGKTYYAAVGVTAASNDTYTVSAITAPSAPTAEADLTNLITVTTKAASSGGGGGSSTTKYTVTYDAGEHGKLDGSATERVESGKNPAKVPSVVADKGYKFVGWTLNGKSVKPASTKITAATKFVAEYEAADKVTYIQGMDKNHFQPAGNATRGQLATMLARLSKDYDASKTYTGKAPDVENGKWYTNTVNFAINQGIMNGFEDGMFRPTENIRRGEFAAMLARYLGLNTSSKAHFADVTDHWAAGYINALADAGIVDGFEDGTFKAQNLLTRAEAVKMINLAVEMKYDEKADYDNSFVDVAKGAWYYEFVMPAANLDVTDYQR